MRIETASTHARKHWVRPFRVKKKKRKKKKGRKEKGGEKEKRFGIVLNDRDFICAGVSWSKRNASQ